MSTELVTRETGLPERRSISIGEAVSVALSGELTQEKLAVVKDLMAMDAKQKFASAFFQLKRNMPEFYADREVKDSHGKVAFVYLSEAELSKILEPHLLNHGFTTLFGQSEAEGKITVNVTLMHEQGHQETRTFTVRTLTPNRMITGEKCDTGAATTAWRHLMIKWFSLKFRIQDSQDPRIEGSSITQAQAEELQRRVLETESNELAFLKFCGVVAQGKPTLADYLKIMSGKYAGADELLRRKETNFGGKSGVAAPSGSAVPTAPDPTAASPVATAKSRAYLIEQLDDVPQFREWAIHAGWLMPNEQLTDISLNKIPMSKAAIATLRTEIEKWVGK